jgi:excisionase family DNA binding protein
MLKTDLSTELLTIDQAKTYLKCSHVFLWQRRKQGKIKSVQAGRKVLILKSSLDEFLKLSESE